MQELTTRGMAIDIFYAALQAVDPYRAIQAREEMIRAFLKEHRFTRILVVGLGKAAFPMARAVEDMLGDEVTLGVVVTKYGHAEGEQLGKIRVLEAGHPIPDENGLRGADEIRKTLAEADENSLVLCLISGGGSALLASPYEGISLLEKQRITELLLKAGADIHELNIVRKHISSVKGGRLAEIAYPATVLSLILSDVIGDSLDVIASGPTAPDSSTFSEAIAVLERYDLLERAPASVVTLLREGLKGSIPETPKKDHRAFRRVRNEIIGSNRIAMDAALEKARALGLATEILSTEVSGEAREVGRWLADQAARRREDSAHPLCLVSGGETTVIVRGSGLGGRNTELALAFAQAAQGREGILLLSAGTDGTDGPTDAAGAFADGQTIALAAAKGLDAARLMENNDSYTFFKELGDLFVTGPTGTNVMDIQLLLIE